MSRSTTETEEIHAVTARLLRQSPMLSNDVNTLLSWALDRLEQDEITPDCDERDGWLVKAACVVCLAITTMAVYMWCW